jgi:hypothetical protein
MMVGAQNGAPRQMNRRGSWLETGLSHEAVNESAVNFLKDKKDGNDPKDSLFHGG